MNMHTCMHTSFHKKSINSLMHAYINPSKQSINSLMHAYINPSNLCNAPSRSLPMQRRSRPRPSGKEQSLEGGGIENMHRLEGALDLLEVHLSTSKRAYIHIYNHKSTCT